MRDLEQQIANWRRTMAKVSGYRPELLNELEQHLRDEIDQPRRTGISVDKAFDMAVSKLGTPAHVMAEFNKLTSTRASWLPVKIARWFLAAIAVVLAIVFAIKGERFGLLLGTHIACVTLGYLMTFVIGGLGICALCAQWFGSTGPTQRHALLQSVFQFAAISAILVAIAVLLGAFWAKDHLGRYWGWDLKETGGAVVLGWITLFAFLRWLRPAPTLIAPLAVLGNIITAWAWFGLNAGGGILHSALLTAFIAAHLLLLLVGTARAFIETRHNSPQNSS
jgi:hypothetical protein